MISTKQLAMLNLSIETELQHFLWILPEHLGRIVDDTSITTIQIARHHFARVPDECVVAKHGQELAGCSRS